MQGSNPMFPRDEGPILPRKLNQVADKMAKERRKDNLEMNVTRIIPSPPSYIMNLWDDFVLRLIATNV